MFLNILTLTNKQLSPPIKIAILGGGPSALFAYKRLIESGRTDFEITIFEKSDRLGAGMPYSLGGANDEHVTNVSDNEIPQIVTSIHEWIYTAPKILLDRFGIDPEKFNEYKVLPRLLFGEYLSAQFDLLRNLAKSKGIVTDVNYSSKVTDIIDRPDLNEVSIEIENHGISSFDMAIICTGHNWPIVQEGKIPSYYDSPYPPAKLDRIFDHTIAIKGSSLTAIDAIKTLARANGNFEKCDDGKLVYHPSEHATNFKMVMHSRNGLLPGVRFHLEDSHLNNDSILSRDEIDAHILSNGGFLSLDYLFENDFKEPIKSKDPVFYERVKHMNVEEFVDAMMESRERGDTFVLLKAEFAEAEKSIKRHESIYWKEMLGVLSFAMNHPAKYLSAEDNLRLHKVLKPLISVVIAYVPQSSCVELMALHDAGVLEIVEVGENSHVEPMSEGGAKYHYKDENGDQKNIRFKTFIDCVGQPQISYEKFPFRSLLDHGAVVPARIKFQSALVGERFLREEHANAQKVKDGEIVLKVPGIAINDNYQIIDKRGAPNQRIYIMAVPYIGGYNPDYSGLDFCEAASKFIVDKICDTIARTADLQVS